jgi:phage-related protein
MWEIVLYEDANGRCPAKEFLDGLHIETERPFVDYKIGLLEEHGYNLKRPHAAPLEKKIYELRVDANKKQFRCLYFFFDKNKIIFSHGFVKKGNTKFGDKVNPKEIKRAVKARTDYESRNENEIHRLPSRPRKQ